MTSIPKSWRAGKAWLCVVSLILMQVALAFIAVFVCCGIFGYALKRSPVGLFLINATAGMLAVFITLLFAQPKTVEQLKASFDLQKPELKTALFLVVSGACLAGVAVFLIKTGHGAPRSSLVEDFSASGSNGMAWLQFLGITAPLIEEFVVRGYLYPAFRQSYSVIFSVVSVLVIAVLNHFTLVMSSILAAAAVLGLNVLLCLIREKTGSLWNCILCHISYNVVCSLT